MLLFQNTETTPELDPTGLPRFRKIQPADVNEILDGLGDHLRSEEGLRVGPIPDNQRVEVLRDKVVAYFYKQLEVLVASLHPDGLLEELVTYYKATVRETALNEMNVPTRLACFGTDPALAARIAEEVPERGEAATAMRFVIEYVVAQPPRGLRPFSLSVLDRLTALASQIIGFGFDCDLVHYGLADLKHSILPSGRFGTSREDFARRNASYITAFMSAQVAESIREFDKREEASAGHEGEESDFIARLDAAALMEFGLSITDILTFLRTIGDLSEEAGIGVSRMPLGTVLERACALLLWQPDKAKRALDQLLSRPREDYLRPPAPYATHETYPWRFNRKLSYIRRPLLLRIRDGIDELVWGPRNAFVTAKYLMRLCLDGRLNPNSKPMRQVMGKIAGRQGEDFNDAVADLVEKKDGLIVRRRVKKVKGLTIPQGMSGDFDVLVADPAQRRLIVLECKALAHARTPYEMATEIESSGSGQARKAIRSRSGAGTSAVATRQPAGGAGMAGDRAARKVESGSVCRRGLRYGRTLPSGSANSHHHLRVP